MIEKTLESPLDCKEIKRFNPKGNQSWIFIGRTDAEMEAPILRLPDVKSQLIGKYRDSGKGWSQKEKRVAEDEMVRWHHWLNGHETESEGCLVMSYCLWPHELQHVRLPRPSLSPRVCSNSCPLSQWCHPTISSSVTPFSSCPQSFPASGSFPVNWLFESGGQSIEASASV